AAAALSDNGAHFRARVANDFGSVLSNDAILPVATNRPPTATISAPATGTLYSGGDVIQYAGTGTDPEDGTLPASSFTWQVDFHHDAHVHPFIAPTSGASSESFTIPTTGETSANVWYRIYLTVRDTGGLTTTVQRDVLPRKVKLTLATTPAGLTVTLDGQPVATPTTFDAVVGIVRTLGAPTPQTSGSTTYAFSAWSDGGAASHQIATPTASTTYTATYRATRTVTNGLTATYFDNRDLTGTTFTRVDPTIDFIWRAGAPGPSCSRLGCPRRGLRSGSTSNRRRPRSRAVISRTPGSSSRIGATVRPTGGTPTTPRRCATATPPIRPISAMTRWRTCSAPATRTRRGSLRSRTGATTSASLPAIRRSSARRSRSPRRARPRSAARRRARRRGSTQLSPSTSPT